MDLTTRMPKDVLLKKIEENKAKHVKMLEDSRKGFVEAARGQLDAALTRLESGEVKNVSVHLQAPQSHVKDYDMAIEAVSATVDEVIELTARDFATLVQDEWDWLHGWLHENRRFSDSATCYALSKGMD